MKTMILIGLLWSMAAIAQPPRMSDADTSFYGIMPCQHDPCVTSVLYTISICADGMSCQPLRFPQFEYSNPRNCIDQLSVMPADPVGWYECTANTVVSQLIVHPPAPTQAVQPKPRAPTAESKSYTLAICYKDDRPCTQMLPAIHETQLGCVKALAKAAQYSTAKLDLNADEGRIYMRAESHDLWVQCYDTRQ